MTFRGLSEQQIRLLNWWAVPEIAGRYNAIICDGAVRSGKTTIMALSFLLWAMSEFSGCRFAFCAKTIRSCERNVIEPLMNIRSLRKRFQIRYSGSDAVLTVRSGSGAENRFYLFGGKDKSSYMYIQGITLAGIMLDEIVLMPRSFVKQAIARCSEEGARLWFNCNPGDPAHWFYREWMQKAEQKNTLLLHFRMQDNPGLSASVLEDYTKRYSGIFYRRYVLGEWTQAEGLVYPMFDPARSVVPREEAERFPGRYYISVDYGTLNPCSMGLWKAGESGAVRVAEFYHDGRKTGRQLTDEEYYAELERLAGSRAVEKVIVDPSAASLIACIRSHGRFRLAKADNRVLEGIRLVGSMLSTGFIRIGEDCTDCIREFAGYRWKEGGADDEVVKLEDHAMDDTRYFAMSVLRRDWLRRKE